VLLLVACSAPGQAQQDWSPDEGVIDPRDTWTCVLYGNPALGDERVLLSFAPDQSTLMAKPSVDDARPWAPLSRWQVEDEILSFRDSRTGRDFQANLRRSTLGGEWRTLNLLGGWWCSEAREEVDLGIFAAAEDESRAMLVPLIPASWRLRLTHGRRFARRSRGVSYSVSRSTRLVKYATPSSSNFRTKSFVLPASTR